MKVKLVGWRKLDFTDAKTGKRTNGVQLFFLAEIAKDGEGHMGDKKFIAQDRIDSGEIKLPVLTVGDEYEFVFGSKGQVLAVTKAKAL